MRFDPTCDANQSNANDPSPVVGLTLPLDYELKGNLDSPHLLVFFNGLFHGESSWVKQQRCSELNTKLMLFIDYPGCGLAHLEPNTGRFNFDDITFALLTLVKYIQNQHQIKTTHFIGYSLGGMLANHMCNLMPTPPASLTFINSAPTIGLKAHWLINNVLLMLQANIAPEIIFSQVYPWFFSEQYLQKIKGMKEYVLNSYVDYNHNLTGLTQFLHGCLGQQHTAKLTAIPSLMISCDGDPLFPPEVLKPWLEHSPQLDHRSLSLSSHVANLEASKQVNIWLKEFIHQHNHNKDHQEYQYA